MADEIAPGASASLRARQVTRLGEDVLDQGQLADALTILEKLAALRDETARQSPGSIGCARRIRDRVMSRWQGLGWRSNSGSTVAASNARASAALPFARSTGTACPSRGDLRTASIARGVLAEIVAASGDIDASAALWRKALTAFDKLGARDLATQARARLAAMPADGTD
jgi:hypothetical protein